MRKSSSAIETKKRKPNPVASQDVYDKLLEMILSFELYPGTRVTETELADHFAVSRTPIREALQRLEVEGHLVVRPKQGCFIRDINIEELAQYYRVRTALELAVVEYAGIKMSTKELEKLARQWDPASKPETVSAASMEKRDDAFHTALAQGSGNTVLINYLRDINNHIRIIRRVGFDDDRRVTRTYQEHHEIIQSLLRREIANARTLMKKHIIRSEEFAKTLTLTELARKRAFARRFG